LHLESATFDTITDLTEKFLATDFSPDFALAHEFFGEIAVYPTGEDIQRVQARVMVTGRESDGSEASEDLIVRYLQHAEHLQSSEYDEARWDGFEIDRVGNSLRYQMADNVGRRLAKTHHGYIGIVPPFTEVGDIVHIFAGKRAPVVLRPGGPHCAMRDDEAKGIDRRGMFRYVGSCYIHGIMKGEAMPLDFKEIQLY
jgi:hypothetical protein